MVLNRKHVSTCENTQYVRIYTYVYTIHTDLHVHIHDTYGFTRTNTVGNTYVFSTFVRKWFQFQNQLFVTRNKISSQSVESLNRTFIFRPCSFSVVLGPNQWSKGVASVYQTLLLCESFNQGGLRITFSLFAFHSFISIFYRLI